MKLTTSFNSPHAQKVKTFLLGTIAGALILNMVGNLFTDLMKGTSGILLNALLRSLTFLFQRYVEMIHTEIGQARTDHFVKSLYAWLFVSSIILLCKYTFQIVAGVIDNHKHAEEWSLKIQKSAELLLSYEALKPQVASLKELKELKDEAKAAEVFTDLTHTLTALKERKELLYSTKEKKTKSPDEMLEYSTYLIKRAKRVKWFGYSVAVAAVFCTLFFASAFVGELYTRDASVFIERSIEILSPTLPPEKILQLRAKYRSVDSAQKFYELHDELQTIAKEKNVTLPKFTVIKR
ncbi:MAG TPA: hypothetical protein VFV58_12000 [Blastocatellia bacterium]|jgi:hypothetical protein|nr:hypothetical protein [Blastocatellia bacterium]